MNKKSRSAKHLTLLMATSVSLVSCTKTLPTMKCYNPGASASCAPKLNCSPYEPNGDQEECIQEKSEAKKQSFTSKSLKKYSHQSKTAQSNDFGGVPANSWWSDNGTSPILRGAKSARLNLDTVYQAALAHSTQIKVFGNIPVIRETGIDEARGAFDTELYSSMNLTRTHEPVGSTLTAGGNATFFEERDWGWESGVRKRLRSGAQVNLAQAAGRTRNNSAFFIPGDQGSSQLTLRVTQPILRGAGIRYNESVIRIAKLDHEIGTQEFVRQLETHLSEVNRSFWALYLARSIYIEKERIVGDTEGVVNELRSRGNLDTMASQKARAESALASRQADLVRSELAIKNAESRLRALINDPSLLERGIGELIPIDKPISHPVHVSYEEAVKVAISCRPEVLQAQGHLKATGIREQMARQDKLPELNAFGESSFVGLTGNGDWSRAVGRGLNDDEPNWTIGATFSTPIERRFTRGRHLRSQVELRQQQQRLKSTMETIELEVEVAYREVTTAYPDMCAKFKAAEAAKKDLEVQKRRRTVDGDGGDGLTSIYLENLVEAQSRLLFAREEFLQSLVIYNVSLTNLERAKGTLIQSEGVGFQKGVDDCGLPELKPIKGDFSKCMQATPVAMVD